MFKRLLLVVLTLALIVGLCSMAFATKDPSSYKVGTYTIGVSGSGRALHQPQSIYPPTTPYSNGIAQPLPNPQQPAARSAAATCDWQAQYGTISYYFNGSAGFGQAVRWTMTNAAEVCSLKTISLMVYGAASTFGASAGVTVYVWADDGTGLPGAVIYSVNVPHASILMYPNYTDVDVSTANLVFSGVGEYHTGFIPNSTLDTYACLMDNGDGGPNASTSLYIQGTGWFGNGGVFVSGDINWVQEIYTCCYTAGAAGICNWQWWHCVPTYRWPGFWPAQRFTAAGECTLKTATIRISSFGTAGYTGGIDVRVYQNSGGLPGAVLGSVHVPHASILFSPSVTSVDLSSLGLVFNNEDYHIGYRPTNPAEDYQPVGDEGDIPASCPEAGVLRGSASIDNGATWDYMANFDPGYDDNWVIQAYTCCAPVINLCDNLNYAGAPFYYWTEPDVYGDQFRNMRFTNVDWCTLKAVNLNFYGPGSVGSPGAQIYIWNSDGQFPTSVITTYVVNPVVDYFPTPTSVDVSAANILLAGDYHVGYSTILNAPTDVLAILSDNGLSGSLRSSEFYSGSWWLMQSSWGVDVNFLIDVDRCCTPPGYCPIFCDPTDQWPTFSHDYARTGQSHLTLGDLCGIVKVWQYDGPAVVNGLNFTQPLIYDDLVYAAYNDRVVAVNLLTGVLVWDTKAIPAYALVITNSLRCQMTIDPTGLYFGTGALRGFAKADLATGALIWARGVGIGNPLPGTPGQTRFAGSIIVGNEVYFGCENSQIYALNATTGADLYSAQLYTDAANTVKGSIYGPATTDGSKLFWGLTANLLGATNGLGAVIATSYGGSFTQSWKWISPFQAILHENFAAGTSFRCNNLFVHASFAFGNQGDYSGYRQNLDPATGAPIWASTFLMGQNIFCPPAVGNVAVFFPNINNGFGSPNAGTRGVRAVTFANSTLWVNSATATYNNNVFNSPVTTCDPYLIYGSTDLVGDDNFFGFFDANTGANLVNYVVSGFIMGTAVASGSDGNDYVVTAIRNANFATSGRLLCFVNGGPRPRLNIPQALVVFPGTNTSEASPVQRTDVDAVRNTGCATLNVTATLEAGAPPTARRQITDVHPDLAYAAQNLAANLVDYSVESMMGRVGQAVVNKGHQLFEITADGETIERTVTTVKPAMANSERLAPPSWVSWILPLSGGATVNFMVPGGGSQNFTFEFDRSGMNFLAPNYYYVLIDSDDPDYFVEATPQPSPQAVIEYQIAYEYCAKDTSRIDFGTAGSAWATNYGAIADGNVNFEFSLDSSSDGAYAYEGTMYFMTSMDDAAWNVFGSFEAQYLYPFYVGPFVNGDCGGCDIGVALPVEYTTNNGATYAPTIGDICTFAMIDSLQGLLNAHQAGPSIGLLIDTREIGTYGADFADFALFVVDINERNGNPINGLYYGAFMDWDIGSDGGAGNAVKGYVYQFAGTEVRGFIGLPQAGSYWPDGTKTDPMYNAHVIENSLVVYPSAPCSDCLPDSLYAFVNNVAEGAVVVMPDGTGPDKSTLATFGKANIAGNGTKTYGFAIYGLDNSANPNGDTEAMAKFINKYAGFARGDVNNDDLIDLRDLVKLSNYIASGTLGPTPFKHLGDVNNDGVIDSADCAYLAAYYFSGGAPPQSAFVF